MATPPDAAHADRNKSVPEILTELWELSREYAKQETIDPLRNVGRFLAVGIPGALCFGLAGILGLLGLLRFLQTETSTALSGNWSWVPYLIVVAVGAAIIALSLLRITKRKGPGA